MTIQSVCYSSNHFTNLCPQFLRSSRGNQYGTEFLPVILLSSGHSSIQLLTSDSTVLLFMEINSVMLRYWVSLWISLKLFLKIQCTSECLLFSSLKNNNNNNGPLHFLMCLNSLPHSCKWADRCSASLFRLTSLDHALQFAAWEPPAISATLFRTATRWGSIHTSEKVTHLRDLEIVVSDGSGS